MRRRSSKGSRYRAGLFDRLEPRLLLAATPFTSNGLPWTIASDRISWVEAENFDNGGEGVAYHDTSAANQGGQYRTGEGVDIEGPNSSTGNTYNIGYTSNGEWMQYTVHVAVAGNYTLTLRTSSATAVGTNAGTAHVMFGATNVTGAVTIPGTGGWGLYTSVTVPVTLAADAGSQAMRLYIDGAGFNVDYISLLPAGVTNNAYDGRGLAVLTPTWGTTTVEAENYDTGGQGVSYFKNNTTQNSHANYNGANTPFRPADYVSTVNHQYSNSLMSVYKWDPGDWTQYTVIASAGDSYEMLLKYINSSTTARTFSVSVNGVTQLASLSLPGTGGGTGTGDYLAAPCTLTLAAGVNVIRITAISAANVSVDGFDLIRTTTFGNGGNSWYLPASGPVRLQAENFDVGPPGAFFNPSASGDGPAAYRPGSGIYTETTSDSGGGYDVGQIVANEHVDFTIRPNLLGRYDLSVRVASPAGGSFHILFNGIDRTGTVTVPATGGGQTWITIPLSVVFTNDLQTMRFEELSGNINLNWIEIAKDTTTAAVLANPSQLGSYAAEPPDDALNSIDGLFDRVYDKQYDWVNKPADAPIPTNDWWTQILESPFAGALWAYPLKLGDSSGGVAVTGYSGISATAGNISFSGGQTLNIMGTTGSFTKDSLLDYSDWAVHYRMLQAGAGYMDVTMMQGSPFAWFEFNGLTPKLTFSNGYTLQSPAGATLTGSFTSDHFIVNTGAGNTPFAIYAAPGTQFTYSNGTLTAAAGTAYIVIGQLPDTTSTTQALFYQHAYAIPRTVGATAATAYNWTFDATLGQISTTWDINTQLLSGAPAGSINTTIQGWMPHNYLNILPSSNLSLLSGYQYANINGPIKIAVGNSYTIVQAANGLAVDLPAPAAIGGSGDYSASQMSYYLQQEASGNASVPVYGGDTYWGGKDPQTYAEFALMAQQLNDPTYQTFLNALRTTLNDWFTYTPGETSHYFAYYQKDKALIGFDPSYGSQNYTDNHFHYGYFVSSAGVLSMLDPSWAQQYKDMVTMVAKQYANWDRTDTRLPFLRTFNPWLGHSFAGGTGDARGNNQESTSEAIQSWQGMAILGAALGDANMLAAGMMGYTIEAKAEQYYWFGTPDNPLPAAFARSNVGILYTDSKSFATFFGANPEYVLGIENLPLWPSMEFNGQYSSIASAATSAMLNRIFTTVPALVAAYGANTSQYTFANWGASDPGNTWINITLGYVQQYDPQAASIELNNNFTSGYANALDSGTGIYYYQAQSHRTHGNRDYSQHLSMPIGGVYHNASLNTTTYIVYNPSASAQTVYVYDASNSVVDSFVAAPQQTTTVLRGAQVPFVVLAPAIASVLSGDSQQFTASVVDQLGQPIAGAPPIVWTLDSGSVGSISSTGLYTTALGVTGTATIRATSGTTTRALPITVGQAANFYSGFSSTSGLSVNGNYTGGEIVGGHLRLTDAVTGRARAAFSTTQVDVSNFVTDFSFQITKGSSATWSEGITFTLQNQALSAVGGTGGGALGYQGIGKSVAIKFDLYSNGGEGTNSTGLFTNGTNPANNTSTVTMPTTDIDLHSGHVFNVKVSYDGTNLTMTITDATTSHSFTKIWQIDIAGTIGGTQAWAGFTGSTGPNYNAIQEILNWTWGKPKAFVTPVSPDPRSTAVSSMTVTFNRPVSGVDWTDFSLKRDGGANLLTSAMTVSTSDNMVFTLGNLNSLTAAAGNYVLSVNGGSIVDAKGNVLTAPASDAWALQVQSPVVNDVYVSSSGWSQAFLDSLAAAGTGSATLGYRLPKGANQLQTLAWTGINKISIVFSENVNATQNMLAVTGANVASYGFAGFSLNGSVATWTLNQNIAADALQLNLSAAVTDLAANSLDGEWTDSVSVVSGNGTPGGNFLFHFNILPADMNHDNNVDGADFDAWYTHLLKPTFDASQGDINADGQVDGADFDIWFTHLLQSLPAAAPIGAGASIQDSGLTTFAASPATSGSDAQSGTIAGNALMTASPGNVSIAPQMMELTVVPAVLSVIAPISHKLILRSKLFEPISLIKSTRVDSPRVATPDSPTATMKGSCIFDAAPDSAPLSQDVAVSWLFSCDVRVPHRSLDASRSLHLIA